MNVGTKIGLAALGGAAIGTTIGVVNGKPETGAGAALTAAGVGSMGLFGAATARGGPFTSQGFGLLGVGMGALWAGMGVTTLLRAGADSSERPAIPPSSIADPWTPAEASTYLPPESSTESPGWAEPWTPADASTYLPAPATS